MATVALLFATLLTSAPSAEAYRLLIDAQLAPALPLAGDPLLLRRVSLDVLGQLPSEADEARFEAQAGADRRDRLLDAIWARPEAARHLGRSWAWALLGPVELPKERKLDRPAFAAWLAQAIEEDRGWDQIVRQLLTAAGDTEHAPELSWILASDGQAHLTGRMGAQFLGTSYECAECHDHKERPFSRREFWSLAAFFGRTRQRGKNVNAQVLDETRGETHLGEEPEAIAPRLPGGDARALDDGAAMRATLARWLTSADNPSFARSVVNRVWRDLIGMPLSAPENALDAWSCSDRGLTPAQTLHCRLAAELVRQGFQLRPLVLGILRSRAYQAASENEPGPIPTYRARVLPPLVLGMSLGPQRQVIQRVKALTKAYGQDGSDPSRTEGASVPLELLLMNGPLATRGAKTSAEPLELQVRDRYFQWLGRAPTPAELEAVAALARTHGASEVMADLEWALLNSSELLSTR